MKEPWEGNPRVGLTDGRGGGGDLEGGGYLDVLRRDFLCFFLIVCFTSYFVFSIAVLPHSPGLVYYHLLLRRETRIPGVAPFSFRIAIWDLSCA